MAGGSFTRETFVRRAALAGGALTAAGTVGAGLALDAESAPSTQQDDAVFAFLLGLEHLQAAFYSAAVRGGKLSGEVAEYARVVERHERSHVSLLRGALGARAKPAASFDFGDATSANAKFLGTAVDLEELGLGAYTGAMTNLTPRARKRIVRVLPVEARHTSWARDLVGRTPAPRAVDGPVSQQQVNAQLRKTGFQKP